MLTNNFALILSGRSYKGKTNTDVSSYTDGMSALINTPSTNYAYFRNGVGYALDIGFGDTTPTATDYDLADGNFANRKLDISNLALLSYTPNDIKAFSLIATNNGNSNVTVKEIGLYFNERSSSANGANYGLMSRTVLSVPIVIEPGESYNFIYRLTV